MLCEETRLGSLVRENISRFNEVSSNAAATQTQKKLVKFNTVNNGSNYFKINSTSKCQTYNSRVELCKSCQPLNTNGYNDLQGAGQDRLGIYIKSVVKGGAADADGRLQAGDQLLKVDGQSLVGITQEKAAEYLVRTGPIVTLEVAKQGAIYHGLATLLSQPSPVMARAPPSHLPLNMENSFAGISKSVSMGCFRYPPIGYEYENAGDGSYFASPDCDPPRPGSPTVLRITVPIITTTPPPPSLNIPQNNFLSVPVNNINCYKIPPVNDLDLREDIFQEHQARLVNCDSEDATATLHRPVPLGEKIDVVRLPKNEMLEAPDWLNLSLERANNPCPGKGKWIPLANTKLWKSDIYLSKSGTWELISGNDEEADLSTLKRRSKSSDEILEHVASSSSDCGCNNNSVSPKSTESVSDTSPKRKAISTPVKKEEIGNQNNSKLTMEEREKALKELEEIVNGIGKISDFDNSEFIQINKNKDESKAMDSFLSSMLSENTIYELSENEIPSAPSLIIISNSSCSSSNDGDFEYGSGRVAALAKYYSQMGEAGIIRGRGGKYRNSRGLTKNQYKSEPNINSSDNEMSPKPGDIILPPSAFDTELGDYDLVLSMEGLKPVGFSMDRLIDIGHGVVIKEVKPDIGQLNKTICQDKENNNSTNILEIKKNNWTQTSPLKNDCEPKEISLSDSTLYNLDKKGNKEFVPIENKFKKKPPNLDLNRKSISVDEIEMRKCDRSSNVHKHYSLIELGEVDKFDSNSNLTKKETNTKTDHSVSNFCTSESIHKTYIGECSNSGRVMKRWMSVDDSSQRSGWTEKLREKEKLDLGSAKDALRRKYKIDAIKGRKNRRLKKLELQRSFVVTPIKLSQIGRAELDPNTLWCRSLDPGLIDDNKETDESRPRRMSERDLPSRVLSEQQGQQGRGQLPPHPPQMHSSKSVPSLNTGNHELERPLMNMNQTVIGNSTMPRPNHEVFNPGYSRTSSTNSIPQKSFEGQTHQNQHQIRSRSNQNLNDQRQNILQNNHINQRQPSNPNLVSSNYTHHQPPFAGHQQPINPYQQHHPQLNIIHQGPPQPGYQQQQQHVHQQPPHQQPPHQQPPHQQPPHQQPPHQHLQQNSPVADNGERFYQNLSIYRNQDAHNGYPLPQNGVGRGKMPSPKDERNPVQKGFMGSQSSLQSRNTNDILNSSKDRPTSAYLPNNYHNQMISQGMSGRSQSSRDMLRQEAKIQEMTEEVRRREMRVTSPQLRSPIGVGSPIQGSPLRYPGSYNDTNFPPSNAPQQPDYSDSPPPPPPPPTSTHPLYQQQMRPESRYAASGGEPPRGTYYSVSPSSQQNRHYYHQGNPWQREEREREAERKRDMARHWRDQQISELTNLPLRNAQQEDQLRALKLEREFERRAEELEEEEEEDQETAERVQGLLRVAHQNDERRSMRPAQSNSQLPPNQGANQQQAQQNAQINGSVSRSQLSMTTPTYSLASAEEKARLQRLKELKMKQAEVEAERMKKKQEEEMRNQGIQQASSYQLSSNRTNINQNASPRSTTSNLRLDNLVINTPATNNNYQTNNGYSSSQASPAGQRLDMMLGQSPNGPPQPPERGSSFAVMSHAQGQLVRSPSTTTSPTGVNSTPTIATAKRVSFQDPPPPPPPTNPAPPLENIREDPNHFINEAETMLASPVSPDTPFTGSTPGVIGAQEVYKDPRQRRLAEQQHQKLLSSKGGAVPEKLSFKEKMKMFAMETGEDSTPKDKVKISRAQRDIDNIGSPNAQNNNPSLQNN